MDGVWRICVVCPQNGLPAGSEIGEAARRLAAALARSGATVVLLRTEETDGSDATGPLPDGIEDAVLPPLSLPLAPCAAVTALSWRCRDWLARQRFDLVLFPDRGGLAYYPLLARRQRLGLEATAVAVFACGPSLWLCEADGRLVDHFDLVVADYQERRAVALADALVAPHSGLVEWMRGAGWTLPARLLLQPVPPAAEERAAPAAAAAVTELVYVGRLARRDGLLLFCAAVERIAPLLAERGIMVRLLGPAEHQEGFDALAHLAERSSRWPFAHAITTTPLDPARLAGHLGAGRLAVLPAPALGQALALDDCRQLGIPLLAGDAAGLADLPAELRLPLRPPGLAERLAAALQTPPPAPPPLPANGWAELVAPLCALAELPPPQPAPSPLVSVCLSHFNRPELLQRAVASILAQSYPSLDIIVVDDGSGPEARARLDILEQGWGERVRVLRQPNRYLGAARNAAAAAARGEYLLFMDDDNVAHPDEVATMVRIALETGAEVLTTVINLFTDDAALAAGASPVGLWVPLGGCAAAGLYSNIFGDANALIRRSAFEAVGGFSEAYGLGLEDWELFARLALSGVRFDVVATPLLWYRQNPAGMLLASINRPAELRRAISGPLAAVPPALAPALLLAQGEVHRAEFLRREHQAASTLAAERLRAMDEMEAMIRERDATIATQTDMIDERNRTIATQTDMIDERDRTIAAQTDMIDERWATMQEMGRRIAELQAALVRRNALISRIKQMPMVRLSKKLLALRQLFRR